VLITQAVFLLESGHADESTYKVTDASDRHTNAVATTDADDKYSSIAHTSSVQLVDVEIELMAFEYICVKQCCLFLTVCLYIFIRYFHVYVRLNSCVAAVRPE